MASIGATCNGGWRKAPHVLGGADGQHRRYVQRGMAQGPPTSWVAPMASIGATCNEGWRKALHVLGGADGQHRRGGGRGDAPLRSPAIRLWPPVLQGRNLRTRTSDGLQVDLGQDHAGHIRGLRQHQSPGIDDH
jgi:hypothetical protein